MRPSGRRLDFGTKLKAARLELGWKQTELAARSGVEQKDISKYEAGKSEPGLENIERLKRTLNKPWEYWFGREPADGQIVNVTPDGNGIALELDERLPVYTPISIKANRNGTDVLLRAVVVRVGKSQSSKLRYRHGCAIVAMNNTERDPWREFVREAGGPTIPPRAPERAPLEARITYTPATPLS